MTLTTDNRSRAALLAVLAICLASTQDAIVKAVSGSYPVYETVMIRGLTSLPLLGFWLMRTVGIKSLMTPLWPQLLGRAVILCSAYFAFVLSIAAMPIANAISIYFTMPFFVAGLSGPFLRERVPGYRWIAISAGFAGVLVMVRPGAQAFEPASLLALYSAFGYAIGQMMGRNLAQRIEPVVIANFQNVVYFLVAVVVGVAAQFVDASGVTHKSLAFLVRGFVWPTPVDFLLLSVMGVLAAFGMTCFINAYRLAEANYVAPFEYSGMVWAVLFGVLLFGDFPDALTGLGAAIVIGAGLWMLRMDARHKAMLLDRKAAPNLDGP